MSELVVEEAKENRIFEVVTDIADVSTISVYGVLFEPTRIFFPGFKLKFFRMGGVVRNEVQQP